MPAFIISTSYTPYLQGALRPRRVPLRARALHGAEPRRLGDAGGRGGLAAGVGAARVRPAGHRVSGGGDDGRRGSRRRRAAADPACRAALRGAAPTPPSSGSPTRTGHGPRARRPLLDGDAGPPVSQALAESVHPVGGGQKLAALEEIVAAEGVDGRRRDVRRRLHHGHAAARGRQGLGRRLAELQRQRLRASRRPSSPPRARTPRCRRSWREAFAEGGRDAVEAAVRTWPKPKKGAPARGRARATVGVVAEEREALAEASAAARLSVRGERVARLG